MNVRIGTTAALGFSAVLLTMTSAHGDDKSSPVSWKKTVIEGKFRSEGVAIADVNKDGKLDVLIGDSWYEAPSWTKHDIRKPGDYGDGLHSYSECMTCWTDDVNGDGWADQIVIGFPGKPAYWYENPKGKAGLLARSTRSGTAPATRRRSTPTSSATAIACWSWAGSPRARTTRARWPGSRPAATRRSPGRCTRSASRAARARRSPARSGSRTAWASAT